MSTQTAEAKAVRLPGFEIEGLIMPGQIEGLDIQEPIPILKMSWADERQWCGTVHLYLAGEIEGSPEEYQGCSSYRAGNCAMNGWRDSCLFLEDETSKGWQRAKGWQRVTLEDGTEALQMRSRAL